MWKKIIKNGVLYAITGPLICGVFISILISALLLATDSTTSMSELGSMALIIIGWSYIIGFLPAFFTGTIITRSRLGLEKTSKKSLFAYGFMGTLAVLVVLNFSYIVIMPKLLIGAIAPAIFGGLATIFIERVIGKFA